MPGLFKTAAAVSAVYNIRGGSVQRIQPEFICPANRFGAIAEAVVHYFFSKLNMAANRWL